MYDYIVFGGGVVGSAILNKLTRLGEKCALIEIQNDVGFGASRANTALIHSGIDCKPNTLKAKLNVRGNYLFPSIAKRLKVKFVQNGHLIVGNDIKKLNELLERANKNGVKGAKLIGEKTLRKLEPNLSDEIKTGIFVPSGGMIESYCLAVAFVEEAVLNGANLFLMFDTKKITNTGDSFRIVARDGRVVEGEKLINCAGAGFNDINKLIGGETFNIEHRRGEYYLLDKTCSDFVNHPVFPLPTEVSKGILVSPTVHGNVLVGPTSSASDSQAKTTVEGLNQIKIDAGKTFKNIPYKENIRIFSGIRTIIGDDFIVERSKSVQNLINVAGICSPGLSASPAIAEMVAVLCGLNPNLELKGLKSRRAITNMNELSIAEQNKIIKVNSDYGRVVCRCENISLGEIKEALHSPVPANSVDAIKRRTRAGMGRCQGGFCIFSVMEEIARANQTSIEDINKDGVNSAILKSKIKP